jgi:hypothetical protein
VPWTSCPTRFKMIFLMCSANNFCLAPFGSDSFQIVMDFLGLQPSRI